MMPDTVRQAPITGDDHRLHRGDRCSGSDACSCCSSPAVSPSHSFKRSKSTVYLLDRRTSPPPCHGLLQPQKVAADGYSTLAWTLIRTVVGLPWINTLLVRAPTLWLRLWLRAASGCARIPLTTSGRILRFCFARRRHGADRRTVLINGGSAVQTLHLARNYYAAGARVIVCDVAESGRKGLCSFSLAVDGYYTVPGPNDDSCVQYVDALRAIVEKERVGYYVPTGTAVSPHYDAVAKSHLELLGCKCCTPGLDGVSVLNDLSEVFRVCETAGLPVPKHLQVCSKEDIVKLYDNVSFRADKHFIVNVGLSGCKTSYCLPLPAARRSLTLPGPVSDDCPWLLVQNCPGSYYTTCTTVHEGKVLGNVTRGRGRPATVRHELIDGWVTRFVDALPLAPFDGILEFRVCITPSGKVVPLGCRVGVPAEYTWYSGNLERIMYPHCMHESLSPEMQITDRYYAPALLYDTVCFRPTAVREACGRLARAVAAQHEMVFACWDPMPGLAYYGVQLLTDRVRDALDRVSLALSAHKNKRCTTF